MNGFQMPLTRKYCVSLMRRMVSPDIVDAVNDVANVVQSGSIPATVPVVAASTAQAVKMFSDPDAVRYFVAGGTCASVSHGITVPIDVVKTRLQTDPEKYPKSEGVFGAAQRIIEDEGVGMLGKGMGPTLTGYCLQGALKYGFYEALKPVIFQIFGNNGWVEEGVVSGGYRVLALAAASAMAELIGSTALSPFEAARIRMVSQPAFADGITTALQKLSAEEGIGGLFNGLPAILLKQLPYTVVSLTVFKLLAVLCMHNWLQMAWKIHHRIDCPSQ
jgi:hypothetical protein